LLLIDGHLRAEITPDSLVPVLIVDLADDEADKLLALFDPLGALAGTDGARLNALVAGINTDSAALREVLSELATTVQTPAGMNDSTGDELAPEYSIIVDCDDEAQQVSLLARFAEEGLRCRAFVV
jgi:hypothetical protein